MLNILKAKENKNIYHKSLSMDGIKKKNSKGKYDNNEYKNTIYYPFSTKEWFNSIYSYNKSYIKSLITKHIMLNSIFKSYLNMFENKIRILFKRRRANNSRYSANKIYVSRSELKHTNTGLSILIHIYNKQTSVMEQNMRESIRFTTYTKDLVWNNYERKFNAVNIPIHENRLTYIFKRFLHLKKWNSIYLIKNNNLLKNLSIKKKYFKSYKMFMYRILLTKLSKLEQLFISYANLIIFNKSKLSNILLNLKDLGLIRLLEKIYNKNIHIQVIELKSLHLNSDVFSQAVSLKLRDRKNKAFSILRKAILQMVNIPDFHTLITYYDSIDNINKDNVLTVIKQQIVSGVRFEAKGRLTRRLTAMRAVFKYRYTGSLKNVRSSYSKKSTTMLRGHSKCNLEYTIIDCKTRNGAFGLKGWVSSH